MSRTKPGRKYRDRYATEKSEPIEIHTLDPADAPDVETEVLFTIDGTEYRVPKEVPPITGLRALDIIADEGEAPGLRWLLQEVLGQDGYDALLACPSITSKQLGQIMTVVRDKAMGDLEAASGN
jgi:hypothetical protein